MSEKKTSLKMPEAFLSLLEDFRLLRSDGDNPNRMTDKQKVQLWKSLQEFGWVYPIVTDEDGLLSNGEQRVSVCLAHGEFFGPVLRLSMTDPRRRFFRQLDLLHGKHNRQLDGKEQERLVAGGLRDDIAAVYDAIGERLAENIDRAHSSRMIPETYELIIECRDETEQKTRYEELTDKGWKVKVLSL